LRALADSGEDITKFIIGAFGEYDMILTPRVASAIATADYLSGWCEQDEKIIRQGMLSTTAKDLRIAADIIDEALSDARLAIVGSAEHLSSLPEAPGKIIKI
jgi:Zn-dependent M16 (insulinase) family peptidase